MSLSRKRLVARARYTEAWKRDIVRSRRRKEVAGKGRGKEGDKERWRLGKGGGRRSIARLVDGVWFASEGRSLIGEGD